MFNRQAASDRLALEIHDLNDDINSFRFYPIELPVKVKDLGDKYSKLLKNDAALLEAKARKTDDETFVLTTINKVRKYELIDNPALQRLNAMNTPEAKHLSGYLGFIAGRRNYMERVIGFLIALDKEIDFRKRGVRHHEYRDWDNFHDQYGKDYQANGIVKIQEKIAPMKTGEGATANYERAGSLKPEVQLSIYESVVKILLATEKQEHHKYMADFYKRELGTINKMTYKTIDPTAEPVAAVSQVRRK